MPGNSLARSPDSSESAPSATTSVTRSHRARLRGGATIREGIIVPAVLAQRTKSSSHLLRALICWSGLSGDARPRFRQPSDDLESVSPSIRARSSSIRRSTVSSVDTRGTSQFEDRRPFRMMMARSLTLKGRSVRVVLSSAPHGTLLLWPPRLQIIPATPLRRTVGSDDPHIIGLHVDREQHMKCVPAGPAEDGSGKVLVVRVRFDEFKCLHSVENGVPPDEAASEAHVDMVGPQEPPPPDEGLDEKDRVGGEPPLT